MTDEQLAEALFAALTAHSTQNPFLFVQRMPLDMIDGFQGLVDGGLIMLDLAALLRAELEKIPLTATNPKS